MSPHDERFMRLALALGRRNNGRTWPNPSVGAVLVDPGSQRIIAQGVTQPGGRPHAEAVALAAAGAAARGATLYVSLEPCSHHGRTPPCAEAIFAAGVKRVVTALADPDPRVAGRGHAGLRETGVEVSTGILSGEGERAHRGHLARIRLGRPAVTVKLARTADGFAGGAADRPRLMISGHEAWARTHLLRAHADAIAVGIVTVMADDPRLDVRLNGLQDRSPVRVVFDSSLRLPASSRLAATARVRPTIVVCAEDASHDAAVRLGQLGIEVIRIARAGSALDLVEALRALARHGLTRLLCEGGPTLAEALAAAGLVDELWLMTSAAALGSAGRPALGLCLSETLASMRLVTSELAGEDEIACYERASCSPVS